MRGMSPAAAAKKRLGVVGGGGGGFALGCGCKDAKAVAVAAPASSPYSSATATEASSTATTAASWRRVRAAAAAHPSSASGSTGTFTVPSASSSSFFPWEAEDAEGDNGDGEEVTNCKRANTPSFSGLLRQLSELEQGVVSWGARKSASKQSYKSPPPPPPPPPPPLPPLPSRSSVVKQRAAVHSGDRHDSKMKEGHGSFSPPPPPPPPPPPTFQIQTHQHRKAKGTDKGDRKQEGAVLPRQPARPSSLPSEQGKTLNMKSMDKSSKQKQDVNNSSPLKQQPKHRKAKSVDGAVRLDGTVAVVKQSDDPLSDFRQSMVNMIVENRIATGDELRDLLRHFLALNAPHHHDAILRAFTEIWDEAFSTTKAQHRESSTRPSPPQPRQRAQPSPQRRRQSCARAWR